METCLYEFGDFRLDPARRLLTAVADGRPVALNPRAFDTLVQLVRRHGELVGKSELLAVVWPGVVVEENNLSQSIAALRRALGDGQGESRYIVTVPGRGYQFVAAVHEVAAADAPISSASSIILPVEADAALAMVPPNRRRRLWWGVAVAVACACAAAWITMHRATPAATGSTAVAAEPVVGGSASTASAISPSRAAVAVLPFINLTGDPGMDYLGDGMAEELINTLSRVPTLHVPARTSSFAYKGRNVDIRQIAKDLGVGTVVQGSVRMADDEVRITAQLIDATSGLHLWSGSYDRKLSHLFKLQDELARGIAEPLQVQLAGNAVDASARVPATSDVEAYRLYLQGTALLDRPSVANVDRAQELFTESAKRDPNYAQAFEGLTRVHMYALGILNRSPLAEGELAEQAARRVLELNPRSAVALGNLGILNARRGRLREAMAQQRAAVALAANDYMVYDRLSNTLVRAGYESAGIAAVTHGFALAPGSAVMATVRALAASHSADWDGARKYRRLAQDLGYPEKSFYFTELQRKLLLHEGRYAEAADMFAVTLNGQDPEQVATGRLVRAVYGALADPRQRPQALAIAAGMHSAPAPGNVTLGEGTETAPPGRGCVDGAYSLSLLGDLDEAYRLANQCLDLHISGVGEAVMGAWARELLPFRRDPRFAGYVARFGDVMQLWQEQGPPDGCTLRSGRLHCE